MGHYPISLIPPYPFHPLSYFLTPYYKVTNKNLGIQAKIEKTLKRLEVF